MTRGIATSMAAVLICAVTVWLVSGCSPQQTDRFARLQSALEVYTDTLDAEIGIGVIVDGQDTVAVNGNKRFALFSVYKLPIAVAAARMCALNGTSADDSIAIDLNALPHNTYSPILTDYAGQDSIRLTVKQLMEYSLQQSDNNASDILVELAGGMTAVNTLDQGIAAHGMSIVSTEAEMYADRELCYKNSATPMGMASYLYELQADTSKTSILIRHIIENCATGADRLAKPLIAHPVMTMGHKTGTGFTMDNGRLMAINDAGYVKLPGHTYSIAVFVSNSGYSPDSTAAIIAKISAMVHDTVADEK